LEKVDEDEPIKKTPFSGCILNFGESWGNKHGAHGEGKQCSFLLYFNETNATSKNQETLHTEILSRRDKLLVVLIYFDVFSQDTGPLTLFRNYTHLSDRKKVVHSLKERRTLALRETYFLHDDVSEYVPTFPFVF